MDETGRGHFRADPLQRLAQRREELGEDAIRSAEEQWASLHEQARAFAEVGRDPRDPEVQFLLARMDELVGSVHGGDPEIRGRLRRLYSEQGEALREEYEPPPRVLDYLDRARAARGE